MAKASQDLPTVGLGVYLVEQCPSESKKLASQLGVSEELAECVVLAETHEDALKAAASLKSGKSGFGLSVDRSRLTATELGFVIKPCPRSKVLHFHRKSYILAVGARRTPGA